MGAFESQRLSRCRTDTTKITLAPSNADVSVGESARMECGASHDPTLDLAFIWSLDGLVIDFDLEREHYQHKVVTSSVFPQLSMLQYYL